jgi:phage gp36-like protein
MSYSTITDFYAYCPSDFAVEFTNDNDSFGKVNNAAGYAIGQTAITFDGFTTNPVTGALLKFGNHDTLYTATVAGQVATVSPALTVAITDNETIKSMGVYNSTNYESARNYADAIIDSYLVKTFSLPLTTTPVILVGLSVRLTLFELKRRRNSLTEADVKLNEIDMKRLADIRDGVTGIDVTETPISTTMGFKVDEQTLKFSRETLDLLR